jgi:DNA mismatch endonuclease (patch repair protein)
LKSEISNLKSPGRAASSKADVSRRSLSEGGSLPKLLNYSWWGESPREPPPSALSLLATRNPKPETQNAIMNRDRLTRERRSWNMSRIRGKDTSPEKAVRSLLHRMGYRFRLNVKIPIQLRTQEKRKSKSPTPAFVTKYVRPDIVLPKHKTAIFVHGCFWHRHRGCKNCTTPTHRREWWITKLEGNSVRDRLRQRALQKLGWRVIVVWECETKANCWFPQKFQRIFRSPSQSH